jgi:hypothetical protein
VGFGLEGERVLSGGRAGLELGGFGLRETYGGLTFFEFTNLAMTLL